MINADIELASRMLLKEIWNQRYDVSPTASCKPRTLINPELAARVIGVPIRHLDTLGAFGSGRDQYEVAGMVDRGRGIIAISRKFKPQAIRFTAAHEIGHWQLHSDQLMFRDRPMAGVAVEDVSRTKNEREADYFAACFLVPTKLLRSEFVARFGCDMLQLNDETAFYFSMNDPDALFDPGPYGLNFPIAVASSRSYGCSSFRSLAEHFDVSVTTMAIRLREVGLVEK